MEKKEQNKTELTPEEMEKVNGGVGDDLLLLIPEELEEMSYGKVWYVDDSSVSREKKNIDALIRLAENANP